MDDQKQTIKYEDFVKLDIRVGTVVEAENVPESEKLIKLTFDMGNGEKRQISTGMQKWYKPEDFIGMQTLVLVNLEPRKMMGLESQGMLLSLGMDHEKKPIFIVPNEKVENGEGIS